MKMGLDLLSATQHVNEDSEDSIVKAVCIINLLVQGTVALTDNTLDSQLRESRFEFSCCRFKVLAILFTPRCLSSLSCINECLAIDSGGYMNESSHSNCNMAEASLRSRDGVGLNRYAWG